MIPTTLSLDLAAGTLVQSPTNAALLTPQINFVELLGSDSLVYGYLGADKRGVRLAARLHAASAQAHDGALPLTFEAQHMHLFDPASTRRIDF